MWGVWRVGVILPPTFLSLPPSPLKNFRLYHIFARLKYIETMSIETIHIISILFRLHLYVIIYIRNLVLYFHLLTEIEIY